MRTLEISGKCSDLCFTTFNDGEKTYEHDGYVPEIEGLGGGDYVTVKVDLDSGKIFGWKVPTNKEVKEVMGIEDENDTLFEIDVI